MFLWSKKEIEMLKTICESGGTKEDAMKIFGRSLHAVSNKAEEMGFLFTSGRPELDMDAFEMYLKKKGIK